MDTLIDMLDGAVARYGDRPALRIRRDDGTMATWSYRELDRRSRLAAWRLQALGLAPGDRLLTWSPSRPELAAAFFGAMRARLILVPLDLRMSTEAIEGIVASSEARHLVLGSGRDAPDPRDARLERFPTTLVDALCAEPDDSFPPDWEGRVAAWDRPSAAAVWELIYTSGTTGTPKGVMLGHDNVLASIATFHEILPRMEHRLASLLPLSHLLEQAVGLFYALDVGADILYVRSRNPRVIFEALRDHRVTSLVVVPQVLDLFWSAVEREVEKRRLTRWFNWLRALGRPLPLGIRRRLFSFVHSQLGGHLRLIVSTAAYLPPALQQAWEDLGVIVLQGYGSTESGTGVCTTLEDHALGTVGRTPEGIEMRFAEDGEIQFRGPTMFHGYWGDPVRTAEAYTPDGWYRTGDIGHLDGAGRLVLSGRKRNIIVLSNGFNVYPEDIENTLRNVGIRDSVVLETEPGRIEAVVLAPGTHGLPQGGDLPGDRAGGLTDDAATVRAEIDAAVKAANARLGPNQRIAGWRLWPDADFPRTHTLKVKRDRVLAWANVEAPLPLTG
jgi:long-chain acyl-CoA synthetase